LTPASGEAPVRIEVFMDYHCPYSYRAVCWLDDLGADLVDVRHRLFALEQVNRDPDAAGWRIWEQPLDYAHYRDRADRRALAAFLATAIVEATGEPGVANRFRRAVYAARFEDHLDISEIAVLDTAGVASGLPAGWVGEALRDEARTTHARQQLADDWAAARSSYLVFGVPTLVVADEAPVYVRLAATIPPSEGAAFLRAFRAFRKAAPGVLELKEPDRVLPS
jgi:predicted DsbA family dithiol-disulfide isomerase